MRMVFAAILGILMVGGVVLTGFLLTLSIQSNTSSAFPEYVIITNMLYGVGSDGWITFAVNNTGIGSVAIVKVLVNNVKQSVLNPLLPIEVEPDGSVVFNVSMSVAEEGTYQIDLFTSQGKMFSKLSQVPIGQQAGVMLYKANIRFYDTNKMDIEIGNSGTSDTQIIQVYLGTSIADLRNMTATPALPILFPHGSIARVTITYNWTQGETYYYRIVPLSGSPFESCDQAPQG